MVHSSTQQQSTQQQPTQQHGKTVLYAVDAVCRDAVLRLADQFNRRTRLQNRVVELDRADIEFSDGPDEIPLGLEWLLPLVHGGEELEPWERNEDAGDDLDADPVVCAPWAASRGLIALYTRTLRSLARNPAASRVVVKRLRTSHRRS